MRSRGRTVERELARIKHRLGSGALLREHRGVHRVGHRAPSVEARYLAAVRACGKGALLCGRAAGHLLGILKGAAPPPEVKAPTERRVEGVRTRARRIDPLDATSRRGIPVTTPNCEGATKLRRILHGDVHVTLSRLEARFLDRLRDAQLPLPTNRPAGGRGSTAAGPTAA